jgi:hypothetical protein
VSSLRRMAIRLAPVREIATLERIDMVEPGSFEVVCDAFGLVAGNDLNPCFFPGRLQQQVSGTLVHRK